MLEPVEQFNEKKLRGGYYTPQEITEFVCCWAIDAPGNRTHPIEASSTDTIHWVRFKERHKARRLVLSFLNSLTFAFSEILGRSYGGGVLTFEPSEVEELPIPLFETDSVDFHEIDMLLREKQIERVLDIIDRALLVKQLGFAETEVKTLRGIWQKLSDQRVNRN